MEKRADDGTGLAYLNQFELADELLNMLKKEGYDTDITSKFVLRRFDKELTPIGGKRNVNRKAMLTGATVKVGDNNERTVRRA